MPASTFSLAVRCKCICCHRKNRNIVVLALRCLFGSRVNVYFSIPQHLLTFLRRLIVSDVRKCTLHIVGDVLHHLISVSAPQSVFILHVVAVEGVKRHFVVRRLAPRQCSRQNRTDRQQQEKNPKNYC